MFWTVMSIILVVISILLLISICLLFNVVKMLIKELYEQSSNISYIKKQIDSMKLASVNGKQNLFESDK